MSPDTRNMLVTAAVFAAGGALVYRGGQILATGWGKAGAASASKAVGKQAPGLKDAFLQGLLK